MTPKIKHFNRQICLKVYLKVKKSIKNHIFPLYIVYVCARMRACVRAYHYRLSILIEIFLFKIWMILTSVLRHLLKKQKKSCTKIIFFRQVQNSFNIFPLFICYLTSFFFFIEV